MRTIHYSVAGPGYEPEAFITNLLYFNGSWRDKFEKSATFRAPFTNIDGTKSEVDIMHGTHSLYSANTEHFFGILVPYGNTSYRMWLFLPDDGFSCADIIDELAAGELMKMYRGYYSSGFNKLELPRFEIESLVSLDEALRSIGVNRLFVDSDDYLPMLGQPRHLGSVNQNVNLKVNEEGSTIITQTQHGGGVGANFQPNTWVRFDRPFIYMIVEDSSNAILLAGVTNRL